MSDDKRLTNELRSSRREEAQSFSLPARNERGEGVSAPAWVKEFKFTGDTVTVEDILAGRAPRPRVFDMYAGCGAIPLEALRLGCEAYALDLNPVAHIIQLCTLVYPQKFGKPDLKARGMTGHSREGKEKFVELAVLGEQLISARREEGKIARLQEVRHTDG